MDTHENIKKYRKLRGLSQSALAELTGYGDRSSIAKIESGSVDLPQSKISAFAKALGVSPVTLMGINDESISLSKAKELLSEKSKNNPRLSSSERLEYLFNLLDYDPMVISFNLDIEPDHLNNWLIKGTLPPKPIVDMILGLLQMKSYELLNENELKAYHEESDDWGVPYNPTHRIPILGRISAGLPLYAEEHIEGYTYTELNHGGEYFALRVTGDSMTAARISEGDILIVRCQDIVENGEIAVVMVNGDEATVKRFHRDGDTVTLTPQSYNPAHQPQVYNIKKTPVRVLGRVVQNQISY